MGLLLLDLKYALRRLIKTPVFTVGAVVIMAIAIGANTAVFGIVNELLLAPPPYDRPEQVVNVYQDSDDGEPSSTSFPAYRDMAALDGVFQSVSATSPGSTTLDLGDADQTVAIEFTTASHMRTLGMRPTVGRWFDESMDLVGAGYYAVVSHRTWQRRFGSDPSIVGQTVRLGGQPVTVIGVGPEALNGVGNFLVTDFWLSISTTPIAGPFRVANLDRREDHWYDVKARLAEGVGVQQAQQAMDALAQRLADDFPELNRGRDITVFPTTDIRLHPEQDGAIASAAAVLGAIVLLILVLASTNLGSLLLVRGVGRGPEVAVRQALGALPGRVARLFLGEALILSVAGGLLGLVLAAWILDVLSAASLPVPGGGELDLGWDGRVLGFSFLLMLGTGLFFGIAPALQSARTDVADTLREDPRSPGGRRRLSLVRNMMVAAQVAVSLILVVGAGVMVRSLISYQRVDPGIDTERLAFLQTDFTQGGVPQGAEAPLIRDLVERFRALPGVTNVALTSRLPVQGGGTTTTVIEDYEPRSGTGSVEINWAVVSPDYFETVGIAVLDGRTYTAEDQFGDDRIVVVNQAAANEFWGGQRPIGRRMRPQSVPDGWRRVVGVVSDSKIRSLAEPPTPMIYYLVSEAGLVAPIFMVRVANDPSSALQPLRSAITAVNPQLPVRLGTMESQLGQALTGQRVSAGILGLFSLLALCLASVGVYTIVSFSVAGRTREVGIRVALGAARHRVVRMVVGEVAGTVALGLAAGAAVVALVSPRLQGMLFGSEMLSAGTLGTAVLILGGAVGLASLVPAWRAARVDPSVALRGP